ncbi:unnamed protein product [Amoebophrya sp. A25]|nr:unnamed protein product [Amoebophrya sp. A25]|eukprot:GSA25T00021601001.1
MTLVYRRRPSCLAFATCSVAALARTPFLEQNPSRSATSSTKKSCKHQHDARSSRIRMLKAPPVVVDDEDYAADSRGSSKKAYDAMRGADDHMVESPLEETTKNAEESGTSTANGDWTDDLGTVSTAPGDDADTDASFHPPERGYNPYSKDYEHDYEDGNENPHYGPAHASQHDADAFARTDRHVSPEIAPPKPYIGASCTQICRSECLPKTLGEEFAELGAAVGEQLGDVIPDAIEDGAQAASGYVAGVGRALAGQGDAFLQHESKTSRFSTRRNKSGRKELLKRKLFRTKSNRKQQTSMTDSECQTECETMVEECSNHLDASDRLSEHAEDYLVDPSIVKCHDMVKLKFIAESGNIQYSSKFGVPPTFEQLASLAEPMDLITDADLEVLSRCAPGGDDAGLNLGGAKRLLQCMSEKTLNYANTIQTALREHNFREVAQEAMEPAPSTISEDVFFVNDVRCFEGCGIAYQHSAVAACEGKGTCATDFGQLLFQLGLLHTETPLAQSIKNMISGHMDADRDRGEELHDAMAAANPSDVPSGPAAHRRGGGTTSAEKWSIRSGNTEAAAGPPVELMLMSSIEATHKERQGDKDHGNNTPPFCRAQMCPPFPLSTLTPAGVAKLFEAEPKEQCRRIEHIADTHPHDLFDGAVPEPEGSIKEVMEPEDPLLASGGREQLGALGDGASASPSSATSLSIFNSPAVMGLAAGKTRRARADRNLWNAIRIRVNDLQTPGTSSALARSGSRPREGFPSARSTKKQEESEITKKDKESHPTISRTSSGEQNDIDKQSPTQAPESELPQKEKDQEKSPSTEADASMPQADFSADEEDQEVTTSEGAETDQNEEAKNLQEAMEAAGGLSATDMRELYNDQKDSTPMAVMNNALESAEALRGSS